MYRSVLTVTRKIYAPLEGSCLPVHTDTQAPALTETLAQVRNQDIRMLSAFKINLCNCNMVIYDGDGAVAVRRWRFKMCIGAVHRRGMGCGFDKGGGRGSPQLPLSAMHTTKLV